MSQKIPFDLKQVLEQTELNAALTMFAARISAIERVIHEDGKGDKLVEYLKDFMDEFVKSIESRASKRSKIITDSLFDSAEAEDFQ